MALLLRFGIGLLLVPDAMDPARDHWAFDYEMGKIATAIVDGRGFADPYNCRGMPPAGSPEATDPCYGHTGPSALEPPTYPYFLAGIFELWGVYTRASLIVALFANCLFSALTIIPLYGIAAKCFSPRIARWAVWGWAFFPYSIYLSASIPWVTTITTLFVALMVRLALDLESAAGLGAWLGFGLFAGFAALTDPGVLAVVPFIGGWACWRTYLRGRSWKLPAAVALLAMTIAPTPWMIRNYRVFHKPVFLRDTFWLVFRAGNSDHSIHWWDDSAVPGNNPSEMREMVRLGELAYLDQKREQSLEFLRIHPGLFARLMVRRIVYVWTGFWSFRHDYLQLEPYDPYNIPFCTAVTILMLIGVRRLFRERHFARFLFVSLLVAFPLVYYVTYPLLRYRSPIDPYIVLLSAYGLAPLFSRERETISHPPAEHVESL